MSQITRQEVLAQWRRRYARAGRIYKAPLLEQTVELFGYQRKAAARALRSQPAPAGGTDVGPAAAKVRLWREAP